MNSERSDRREDQPDYDGWRGLDHPTPEPAPDACPASHSSPDPPEGQPAYGVWEPLTAAFDTGLESVGKTSREIRLMTPPQLGIVGAILGLSYLGVNAPDEADTTFAGWLTVVIILAVLGGLAIFWGTRHATNRASGADPPADVGDDAAGE